MPWRACRSDGSRIIFAPDGDSGRHHPVRGGDRRVRPAGSFVAMLALRICVGIGGISLSPAALSLIAQKFPRERLTTAISVFSMGPKMGTAFAFALGGIIVGGAAYATRTLPTLHAVEPWRLAFAITAIPSLFIGLLC
jgi:MFS family permease